MTNILGKYGRIGSKGVREKRRGIEYLIGPHRRVLYGGYRFSRGAENQLRYRPARLARDASLRGDRNGRITPDRTILPPDQTDREGRILKSLGSIMHLV